jgi:hypothetical protein
MRKLFVFLLLLFTFSSFSYSYILIDTNKLNLKSEAITNTEMTKVIEPELPNSYLSTGKIEFPEPETVARRYDLIFFIAIPITYYLTLNIMQIKNIYVNNNIAMDPVELNYIYINTFLIPLVVAYFDYLYVQEQNRLKDKFSYGRRGDSFCFALPLYSFRF